MKKKISIIVLSLVLALAAVFMVACGTTGEKGFFGDYDFTNPPEKNKTYDTDPGVTLDGKFDEDFWKSDLNWWEGTSSDGSKSNNMTMAGSLTPCDVRATSYFTDKGAYFAITSTDSVINVQQESMRYEAYQKTGMSLYLAPFGVTDLPGHAYELIFAADGTSMLRRYYLGGYNNYPLTTVGCGVNIRGAVNELGNASGVDGYDLEVFIPWAAIGIEEKPEYLYAMLSTERHQNTTDKSQFGWELVTEGADFGKPNTWSVFTENGLYKSPAPTAYTVDGDDSDWAGYAGKVLGVDSTVDSRYLKYKAVKAADGVYFYAEALQRLWLTGSRDWYRNTNVEIQFTDKNGGGVQYYITSDNQVSENVTAVMKRETKQLDGIDYNLIKVEYFVSNQTLFLAGVDEVDGAYRAGLAFRNGTYQKEGDSKTEATNETIERITIDAPAAQPFIWYALGSSPWTASQRPYISARGFSGIIAKDKTIDGDYADWNDYYGVDAVAYGRSNVTNGSADTSSMGKGFEAKAIKGTDGVYVYATVHHAQWKTTDLASHMNSNLAVGFALTNTSYTGNNDTLEWFRGHEIFFTSVGSNYGPGVDFVINRSEEKDDKGLYNTVIEGFIPYDAIFDIDSKDEWHTNKEMDWSKIFNTETGEVADGYALRIGFQWRTAEEYAYMQGRNNRNDWVPCIFESVPTKDNAWKMYFLDEAGTHTSRVTGEHFGKIDWDNGYTGLTSKVEGTGAGAGMNTTTKAVLKNDGLYIHMTAKMKHFVGGIAENGNWWNYWYKNSCLEIKGPNAKGELVEKTNASGNKYYETYQLAYVSAYVTSNSGDIFDIDYIYNVTYDGTYYNITLDVFIDNAWLMKTLGYTEKPTSVVLGFAYGINYDGSYVGMKKEDYIDKKSDGAGDGLWAGNIWSTTNLTENGLYRITENGMSLT